MSGKSNKSCMVSFRLSKEAHDKITATINNPNNVRNQYHSVSAYCKAVVERHAFRHSARKFREG